MASATTSLWSWPGLSVFQAGVVLIFVLSLAAEPAATQHDDRPTISNIRKGGRLCQQVIAPEFLGCRRAQGVAYGSTVVVATPVGECRGMVTMAANCLNF
jgi:hypothetical protein